MNKFYITTAIPYVNAKPHIGHALEFIQSDVVTRHHKILGNEVLFLCGGDENAIKNVQAAEKEKIPIQEFVDKNSQLFADLAKRLNVHFDVFKKGSDKTHHLSSQKLWQLCFENGDIYKKEYEGLYCVGCELFYEQEELSKKSECFEHPGIKLQKISEVNYFFKLSKYQNKIENLIESDKVRIIPDERKNEAISFIKQGLKDISISRSNERARSWGVQVPNDPTQRMYVWFDALNIYQSGIGFGLDEKRYKKWWPADLHVIGKGILRFHAIFWPALLLSAKLPLPKSLFVHGYLTVNGQKMSKTLGNVVDPTTIIDKYGADVLRYYLLREISPFTDGDFSENRFKEIYNADLANGLGNLVARVAKLAETSNYHQMESASKTYGHSILIEEYSGALSEFRFNDALAFVWKKIAELNRFINQEKPWELTKQNSPKLKPILSHAIDQIQEIVVLLKPFLPQTSQKIEEQFRGPKITSQKSLFPRI